MHMKGIKIVFTQSINHLKTFCTQTLKEPQTTETQLKDNDYDNIV